MKHLIFFVFLISGLTSCASKDHNEPAICEVCHQPGTKGAMEKTVTMSQVDPSHWMTAETYKHRQLACNGQKSDDEKSWSERAADNLEFAVAIIILVVGGLVIDFIMEILNGPPYGR